MGLRGEGERSEQKPPNSTGQELCSLHELLMLFFNWAQDFDEGIWFFFLIASIVHHLFICCDSIPTAMCTFWLCNENM